MENDLTEVDVTCDFLELDTHAERCCRQAGCCSQTEMVACKRSKRKDSKPLPLVVFQKNNRKTGSILNLVQGE